MIRPIKVLELRILDLRKVIVEAEATLEIPEMVCDVMFANNTIDNAKLEIKELQKAIKILNNNK